MKSLKVMSFQELTTSAIDVVGQPLKMLETFSGTKCSNFMALCPLPPGRPSRFICVPDICRSKAELFALCGCRLVLGRSKTSKKNDRGVQESRSCRGCIFFAGVPARGLVNEPKLRGNRREFFCVRSRRIVAMTSGSWPLVNANTNCQPANIKLVPLNCIQYAL